MGSVKNGVYYEEFKTGEYIKTDLGKRYIFLENTKNRIKGGSAIYSVKALDEEKGEICFLKFAYYDSDGRTNWIIHNLYRESQFKFNYAYIEHVFEDFSGIDPLGKKIYCVCVEYIEGYDLREFCNIQWRKIKEGTLDETEYERKMFRNMLEFLYGVNYYMSYDSEPYLHRDLKPENLIISKEGKVIIIDFDFAHISQSTNTGIVKNWELGKTRGYTDPRTVNAGIYDKMSDIYSIGKIFFFWLNGYDYFKDDELGKGEVEKEEYCKDLSKGFGFDKLRFRKKYMDRRYTKLLEIINNMCTDPATGRRYADIETIIKDMTIFFSEYYKCFGKKYEDVLQVDEMPLLKKRIEQNSKGSPMVLYKVLSPKERKHGHVLQEYTMRDIVINNELIMTIYIIAGVVYFIPSLERKKLIREREGEDFEIHSCDIFETDSFKIQFYIQN